MPATAYPEHAHYPLPVNEAENGAVNGAEAEWFNRTDEPGTDDHWAMEQPNTPDSKPPSRLERITPVAERFAQAVQLLGSAILLALLDTYYYTLIHSGDRFYGQAWLTVTLPIVVTRIWLSIAALNVRQLWREWQAWRATSQRQEQRQEQRQTEPAPPSLPA